TFPQTSLGRAECALTRPSTALTLSKLFERASCDARFSRPGGAVRSVRHLVTVLSVIVLLAPVSARAQISTGEIAGRVTDGTGAVLPGVTVTLTSSALIQPQSVVTASSGGYRFPDLPIGTYTVSFELGGFKRAVHENVVIQVGF